MNLGLIALIVVFVSIFVFRIPFSIGILAGCIFYFLLNGDSVGLVANVMMNYYYISYVLLAVPLFLLTANFMNSGKVTDKIFTFSSALIGHRRGALGYVNVLASLIFAGMTGAYLSDAAGLGLIEIDAMKKAGYDDEFSCSITATTATLGPIFPPSIPFVIYSLISNTSIAALFLAGMLPALLITAGLMLYVGVVSKKRNYPYGPKMALRDFLKFTLTALPAIITPVILLAGMYTGVMTATEAGAVACLYAVLISVLFYRTLPFKEFINCIRETVKSCGSILLMVGAASVMSNIFVKEGIGQVIFDVIMSLTAGRAWLFMILVIVTLLILGCFIDSSATTLIVIPLLIPAAEALGIDLVHFGVVVTLGMMIGFSTPPFGLGLFVVAGISGTPLANIIKEIWKPIVVLIACCFILGFVPQISLFLPSLFQ